MAEILFLAHRVPFPPDRGDRIRAHHLLTKLASLGPVHVGALSDEPGSKGLDELARIAASHHVASRTKPLALAGIEAMLSRRPVSLTAFHSPSLKRWVKRTVATRGIDAIVIFSGQMGQYVPDDFTGRVIIDLCDVDSAKFDAYADAGERAWLNRREARLLACEEERLSHRADATILISEAEAALLRSRMERPEGAHIEVMGNGIDAGFFNPATIAPDPGMAGCEGPHLVFTGQMDYRPNERAARFAALEVLPLLRRDFPAARFHVVGRNPTRAVMALADEPGVRVHGEVPDIRPFLAAAHCVIAPLDIARGVQNKVLEAMAMARPVILTREAATGIAGSDGEHWHIVGLDGEAMAASIAAQLRDPDGSAALGIAARRFVLEHHDWDAMLAPLESLISPSRERRDAA